MLYILTEQTKNKRWPMKNNRRLFGILFLLTTFFVSCKDKISIDKEISFSQAKPTHIVKKEKGPKAFDSPDEYSKYFDEIRSKDGASRPAYGYNYKLDALERAYRNGSRLQTRTTTFTERGPSNVPGRTRSILADPLDPLNSWLAASVSGGIWRTTNGGQNWTHLTPDLPNLMFTTLARSAADLSIIYAGTGERALGGAFGDGDGMFKSIDGGTTWTQLSVGAEDPFFQNISRIIVSPTDPNLLVACGGTEDFANTPGGQASGVFRSTDGGENWTRTFSHGFSLSQIIAAPTDFNRQYLSVVGEGVYRSTDGGVTWEQIFTGLPEKVGRAELAIGNNPNWIFASLERRTTNQNGSSSRIGEVYYSLDGGSLWQRMKSVDGGIDRDLLGGQGWYDNTIMVHPYNDSILYVGGVNVWQIRLVPDGSGSFLKDVGVMVDSYFQAEGNDRGKNSWFRGGVHPDQHFLTAIPGDAADEFRILLGNDGGIFITNSDIFPGFDNGSWTMVGNTYNTTQFYGADKRPGFQQYVGGSQDNGTWVFSGQNGEIADFSSPYNFIIGGDGFEVVWNKGDPSLVLGGSQFNNFVRVNVETGQSTSVTQGLDDVGRGNAPFVSRLANAASDPDLVYTGGNSGLWRSDDFGANWSLTPLTDNWFGSPDVAVSLANPQVVWAATGMSPGRSIQVSTDGGNTLKPARQIADVGRITGIYTDPLDENTAYVLFSQKGVPKILRTKDLGRNWEDLSGFLAGIDRGFPDVAVFSIQVMPYDPNIIWVGTEIGIFESVNDGESWNLIEEFPKVMVWDLTWVDDEIVISTYGRGIWTATIPELGSVPIPDPVLAPRIICLTNDINISRGIILEAELREAYDSTQMIINGIVRETFPANSLPQSLKKRFVQESIQDFELVLISYKDGIPYAAGKQLLKEADRIDFILPVGSYTSDFDRGSDFALSEFFEIGNLTGFSGNVLHTDHPYQTGQDLTGGVGEYTAVLRFPIVVSISDPKLRYRDVALVELGEPGASFGQSNFYDFVVVEGSKDLKNWKALSPGYDAGFSNKWETPYRNDQDGNASMFVDHEIDLSQQFEAGDTIAIRFRLFSDPLTAGWGWAIDKLEIQTKFGGIDFENLANNVNVFPNPTTGKLTVLLEAKVPDGWEYQIVDASGRKVQSGSFPVKGVSVLELDISNLAGGMYFLQFLDDGEVVDTKKIIRS